MYTDVLIGLQWGDEGKGKIIDYLAPSYDIIARFQGGPNAGHTLVIGGKKFVLHTVPSGIFHEHAMNIIGNGVVINPVTLRKEIEGLEAAGINVKSKLLISQRAALILPTHKILDAASEAQKGIEKIGSTLRGIGPTYMDKTGRNGLRIGNIIEKDFRSSYEKLKEKHLRLLSTYSFDFDLQDEQEWFDAIEYLKGFQLISSEYYCNNALRNKQRILAEGAQGVMLDVEFGTFPYVTSSNTVSAAACIGLGIPAQKIREVIGISKAYCTRVGSGPFPTELDNEEGEALRKLGNEFGATTGRPRRCGWIDLPALKYAAMISGCTQLAITKMDVLDSLENFKVCDAYKIDERITDELPFSLENSAIEPRWKTIKGWHNSLHDCKNFESLPAEAKDYIHYLEKETGIRVSMLSNGPERESLIVSDSIA